MSAAVCAHRITSALVVQYWQYRGICSTSIQSQQQRLFRRTKRANYADRERVMFADLCDSTPDAATEPMLASSFTTTAETIAASGMAPSFLSRSDEAALRRSRVILNALATPLVGRLTYYTLTAMAYLRYGVGRVSLYTRYSAAPTLLAPAGVTATSSAFLQHLINIAAYEQAAAVSTISSSMYGNDDDNSNSYSGNHADLNKDSVGVPLFRGILHGMAVDAVRVGRSSIHGRGLIASRNIPRGSRIITTPQRTFMDAASFLPLLADTHTRLPDTWHYTHPTGVLLELVTRPLPHHLMNHSCNPNVCCGLSREFWPVIMTNSNSTATGSTNNELLDRMRNFPHFDDANSFFTTRDVPAGEELTLSYTHRVAPLFSGEVPLRSLHTVCRCGADNCRHFVYRPPDAVMCGKQPWLFPYRRSECNRDVNSHTDNIRSLLEAGFDDETVMLSLLPSRVPLLGYMRTHLAPFRRTTTKRELLMCYRHVFKLLNEAAPEE